MSQRLSLVSYHYFRNIGGQLDRLIDCFINILLYMQTSQQASGIFIVLFIFINDNMLACYHWNFNI